jgi:hypothetical protein
MLSDVEERDILDQIDNFGVQVGEGPSVKGARYVVYRLRDKHYALLLVGHEAWTELVKEISESEIKKYI